jgi:hypothetical protein|nr:MAG TPA: hypothetical protein [Caudoviricetes sp.]
MSAQKVIDIALAEVGYLEKATNANLDSKTGNAGYNNYTKYARDLANAGYYNGNKNGYAWCDVFVDWCFFRAYGKAAGQAAECQTGNLGAGCSYSAQYYKAQGRFDKTPQVGDQIFFYDSAGVIGHTGLVYAVNSTTVYTVEGNTSGASGVVANGGGVCRKSYSRSYGRIAGYGHPKYPAGTKRYTIGWNKDDQGWWYADTTTTYYKSRWAEIGGEWYYFDEKGYMLMDTWKVDSTGTYYLGEDGKMMTNRIVGLGADGKLRPMERYYHLLSDLPDYYRKEIDPLIAAGKLKGKSGKGENLVLDMPESTVRAIIVLNRV